MVWDEKYADLISFNKNAFKIIGPELQFNDKEKYILNQIKEVLLYMIFRPLKIPLSIYPLKKTL
jgi:hypothetical protein